MTQPAQQLAAQILDGFNRHYTRFRECARAAKVAFEQADWAQIQKLAAVQGWDFNVAAQGCFGKGNRDGAL